MTNQNKKKKPPGSYRAPTRAPSVGAAQPARSKGFMSSLFAPKVPGATSMPRIRISLARGVVAILASPVLVLAPVALVLLEWLLAIILGFQGPFAVFANALALPPVGTSFDANLATSIFGLQGGLFAIIGFVAVRAVVQAVLIALIVEMLDQDHVTAAGLRRLLVILPTTLAVSIVGMGLLTVASFLAPLLGAGFGILIQVGVLVVGVYLFAFAPVIAAAEGRPMPECMARSIRAARMPGAGNLSLAFLYVIPSIALLVAPGRPGSLIGVNPTPGAWAFTLLTNLLHVILMATFAFRYLSITDEVPDARERPQRSRRR
jgi:hypothetical protein